MSLPTVQPVRLERIPEPNNQRYEMPEPVTLGRFASLALLFAWAVDVHADIWAGPTFSRATRLERISNAGAIADSLSLTSGYVEVEGDCYPKWHDVMAATAYLRDMDAESAITAGAIDAAVRRGVEQAAESCLTGDPSPRGRVTEAVCQALGLDPGTWRLLDLF